MKRQTALYFYQINVYRTSTLNKLMLGGANQETNQRKALHKKKSKNKANKYLLLQNKVR